MIFNRRHLAAGIVALLMGLLASGPLAALDPHRLYERRCAGCHVPHAGDFAQESLTRSNGTVVGRRNGKALRAFLAAGHGKLSPPEVEAMVEHLAAILVSGGLFREKCTACHRRAAGLARTWLVLKDGKVTGRYTGRDIAVFLENHGRLTEREVPKVLAMLERQLRVKEN